MGLERWPLRGDRTAHALYWLRWLNHWRANGFELEAAMADRELDKVDLMGGYQRRVSPLHNRILQHGEKA